MDNLVKNIILRYKHIKYLYIIRLTLRSEKYRAKINYVY